MPMFLQLEMLVLVHLQLLEWYQVLYTLFNDQVEDMTAATVPDMKSIGFLISF